ncbi:ankyrin repeat-containing domain protein [Cladorrhinum sp. PSN259]|nr:ankyrin repeat-containing domain protein [Cladorrhinum sp. PSN259]
MPSDHYSPLPKGSVRLLRLLPHPDETSRIECHLSVYHLLDSGTAHHYDALSYAWGSGVNSKAIWINDREYVVSASLHAALLHLRDCYVDRLMWVDAICIDQQNTAEKSQQVQSMAKIYAKASRVIVWLGEATATTDQALEDIRMSSSQKSTSMDNINKQAILDLIERPWFQRIWVVQEVAAARHVLVKCGPTEIDGYVFGSGLNALKRLYDGDPNLRSLILPITYLIRNAVFQPRYNSIQRDRFSLSIRPLGELVDMFHTRKATVALDKVYALLGMSSDDPGAVGLLADYDASWQTVFEKLITFSLSNQISVETWDGKEVAVISGKGCVLGEVWVVEGDRITWKDTRADRREYSTLPAAAKPIQPGDVICLLQGASRPTIIRLHSDFSAVIRIAAPFTYDSDVANTTWLEPLESITTFPVDFLLVWDWEIPQDRVEVKEYEDFRNGQGLFDQESQQQNSLDRATRLWRMGRVLESIKRDQEAGKNFQKSVEIGAAVLGGAHSLDPSHTNQAAWVDLFVEDRGGWAALLYAAKKGYEAVVRLLLEKGAAVEAKDKERQTPLIKAAAEGHGAIIRQLLEKGAAIEAKDKERQTPLIEAAIHGHEAVVRQLLEKGAAIEAKDIDGRTPLMRAAINGHEAVVRQLLEKGASIEARDKDGRTPLIEAAIHGHEAIVRQLLEKGASIEANGKDGRTPLIRAAIHGHEAVVRQLLEKGAAIEAKDKNRCTPLRLAVEYQQEAVIRLLLEKGAAIEAEDGFGWTPLTMALSFKYEVIVRLLLKKDVAVEVKDSEGLTPLMYAVVNGHEAFMRQLREKGARC